MYYGEIKTCDIANGVGVRVTLFVSGCTNHCENCFQPQTWDFHYGKPFDENGRAAAKELCQACKALDIPMEYNLHDRFLSPVTHRRSYPDAHFFEIVRQEGVRVLIGVDAHEPEEIRNPAQWELASRELEPFGALFEDHLCL